MTEDQNLATTETPENILAGDSELTQLWVNQNGQPKTRFLY